MLGGRPVSDRIRSTYGIRSATGLVRGRKLLRSGDGAEGRVQSRDTEDKTRVPWLLLLIMLLLPTSGHGLAQFGTIFICLAIST
jgi:hypothetical protein